MAKRTRTGIPAEIMNLLQFTNLGRFTYDIQRWRNALNMAEMQENRAELYALYRDIMDDDQVTSSVQQRKNGVLLADFEIVDDRGEVNEEVTKYFRKIWFYKFLNNALDSIYYGFSLISLTDFEPVPYVNLYPEAGAIRRKAFGGNTDENVFVYLGTEYEYSVVEAYLSRKDLGLLNKVAPFYIWKKAFGDWAELGARFGMPFRIVRTDLMDVERVRNAKRMLENMIGAGWAILDETDEYTELQRTGVNVSADMYDKLIQACDRAIAKVIVGQTSTTDVQPWAGTSQVHKSILETYIANDKIRITAVINDQLLPKLAYWGIVPEGLTFRFTTSDNLSLKDKVQIITQLNVNYDVPVDFVQDWTGVRVEPKMLPGVTSETEGHFVEVTAFEELNPTSLDEKVLKGGIVKVTAETADGKKVTHGYRFPYWYSEKQIQNWLRQRGIKTLDYGAND